jgi:glycine betaine catabolism A
MLDRVSGSIEALLRARRPGHSLPAALYTRRDVFEADLDVIFSRHWILIGLDCDVPDAGDVTVVDVGRSSIALVRGDDGQVRAFFNVCRHRGAKLLPAGNSVVGKLVCPYHQWTYELTGDLIRAPHMGTDFDAGCHGLKPVHLRSVGGLLYACLADAPPSDIDDLAAIMEPRLAPYDIRNARVAHQTDVIEKGNWKLVIENNRECYHCAANHPELCVSFIDLDFGFDPATLSADDRATAERHGRLYAETTAAWEADGHPSAAVEHVSPHHATNFRTQRLIIAGGGESQTLDGLAACSKLLGKMARKDLGDLHLWGHNGWNHFMGDHAVCAMVVPLSPDETLVRTKWLVHKDAVEGVDYDLGKLTEVWNATNQQDADLVAMAHAGVSSQGYTPGPYSRFTEGQLDHFMAWYVARMQANGF